MPASLGSSGRRLATVKGDDTPVPGCALSQTRGGRFGAVKVFDRSRIEELKVRAGAQSKTIPREHLGKSTQMRLKGHGSLADQYSRAR